MLVANMTIMVYGMTNSWMSLSMTSIRSGLELAIRDVQLSSTGVKFNLDYVMEPNTTDFQAYSENLYQFFKQFYSFADSHSPVALFYAGLNLFLNG